jgi:molecular chaperone HscC
MKTFSTIRDGQTEVKFNIYQGESRNVVDNIHLGAIKVPVPLKSAGRVSVECRFTYDINGLIEVDVHVPETSEHRQLLIVDSDGPSGDDLERQRAALAKLKVHPRDTDAARAALARAARCYEDFLGEKRDFVGAAITRFEAVLDSQDPRAVERALKELSEALDALEGETYL